MIRPALLAALLAGVSLAFAPPGDDETAAAPAPADTAAVAEAFVEHVFVQRDLARVGELLADDVLFIDPTADYWQAPLAQGLRGREAFLGVMRRANVERVHFDVQRRLVSGEYALLVGELDWKSFGQPERPDIPLTILLRVQDGKITERWDHGDYDDHLPGGVQLDADARARREALARRYLAAYAENRFADLSALLAPDASFQDPTAAALGGGQVVQGRSAICKLFEQAFAPVQDFTIDVEREIFSHNHAIFVGACRYGVPGSEVGLELETLRVEQDLMIVLTLDGGHVRDHRDVADHDAYLDALRAAGG